jgi:hypothetical protein
MKMQLVKRKGLVTQTVIAVISAATALFIGIWVISTVIGSINQSGWSSTANTTFTNTQSIMWSSLQLLAVGLIVLAAAVILAYFGFGGEGKK